MVSQFIIRSNIQAIWNSWHNHMDGNFILDFINTEGLKSMTLTKAQIVELVKNHTGFPKNRSSEIVETFLEINKITLASGEDVLISGFGKFCVKSKAERKGRNPSTDEVMMLAPRKVVTFKCFGKLRDRING